MKSDNVDNCFYDDSMNPLMMESAPFHEHLDSIGSGASSSQYSHGQKKLNTKGSSQTGKHPQMGLNDQCYYQGSNRHFNYDQGHHHIQNHLNQVFPNNVYLSDNRPDKNSYDNRCKRNPYDSVQCPRRNISSGYFPYFNSLMNRNSEMYSQPQAEVTRDDRSSSRFSEGHSSCQRNNSNYSVASIGATGLPSPARPFHWVPNQRSFFAFCNGYMDHPNSFLNAALTRYGLQQQRSYELNHTHAIDAPPQGSYPSNCAPQQIQPPNNMEYDDKSERVCKKKNDKIPDEPIHTSVEPNSQLSFYGPIGLLGFSAAEKYNKLKGSSEVADIKERDLRLNVWCSWDILLEAPYVDSPRGLDDLEENLETTQGETRSEQSSTDPNTIRKPKEQKNASRKDSSSGVPEMDEGSVPKIQNWLAENSKYQRDASPDSLHATYSGADESNPLESVSDSYLCLNSMLNLWDRAERNHSASQFCSEKSVTNSTISMDVKSQLYSHKSARELALPLISYDADEGNNLERSQKIQDWEFHQQNFNPKKKKRNSLTRKVKRIINKLTLGNMFPSNDPGCCSTGAEFNSVASSAAPGSAGLLEATETSTRASENRSVHAIPPLNPKKTKSTKVKEIIVPADSDLKAKGSVLTTVNVNYTCYALSTPVKTESVGPTTVAQPTQPTSSPNEAKGETVPSTGDPQSNTQAPSPTPPSQPAATEGVAVKSAPNPTYMEAVRRPGPAKLPVLPKHICQGSFSPLKALPKKGLTVLTGRRRGSESYEKSEPDRTKCERSLPNDKAELTAPTPRVALPQLSKAPGETASSACGQCQGGGIKTSDCGITTKDTENMDKLGI
ncbi:unnamed protein product [Phytomonas sp. Hart1]|nr:unnamed protein product [Phytomonas sp. Hart1]|eukprot:CCW66407.1 unnamed protein product [Phytomonas sp. isolate Hart1]